MTRKSPARLDREIKRELTGTQIARGSENESFASVHRRAVKENDRALLNQALARIWDATHVAAEGPRIYTYGSQAECREFAEGLRRVEVRPITPLEQNAQAAHARKVFRL